MFEKMANYKNTNIITYELNNIFDFFFFLIPYTYYESPALR